MGKQWKQCQTLFSGAPKSLQMVTAAIRLKDTLREKSYDQPRQHIKKQTLYFANKGRLAKAMVFPVVMYGCEFEWFPGVGDGQGGLACCDSWGRKESDMTERLPFHFSLLCIGEGNGNPLQCSCLENPRDGGAWWAAVYGVAQSWVEKRKGREETEVTWWR